MTTCDFLLGIVQTSSHFLLGMCLTTYDFFLGMCPTTCDFLLGMCLTASDYLLLPVVGAYYNGPKFKCQPVCGTGLFSYKIWIKNSLKKNHAQSL